MSKSSEQRVAGSEQANSAAVVIVGFTGIALLGVGLLCVAGAIWGLLGVGCMMTGLGVTVIIVALVEMERRAL